MGGAIFSRIRYIFKKDYKAFLLDDEQEIKINTIPSRLKDIFVDKKYYNNLGGDEDFINNIYSNDTQKLKNSLNKSKQIRQFRIFLK